MKVLVLAGPTASGKTDAALAVAEVWGATIVSADAMQVYRGMDIGTAKVDAATRARVPHVGIDVVEPNEPFDAAMFADLATAAIGAGGPVVVAGGTSLYLRGLTRGLVATPPADAELRRQLEELPDPHAALAEVDPVLAARLHPNDRLRIVRGLEVFRLTNRPLSSLHAAHELEADRVDAVGLWIDRPDLDARIEARVFAMVAAGYVEEVRGLLERGFDRWLKPMQSLGYRHLCEHVLDGLPLDEAIRRTLRDTRRFAKKQRNWLKVLGYPRVDEDPRGAALAAAAEAFSDAEADAGPRSG